MYKGSTDQKTGESMEKPGKKLKKFFIITGITGMVYAGLKYLLPLVVPLLSSLLSKQKEQCHNDGALAAKPHHNRIAKGYENEA